MRAFKANFNGGAQVSELRIRGGGLRFNAEYNNISSDLIDTNSRAQNGSKNEKRASKNAPIR